MREWKRLQTSGRFWFLVALLLVVILGYLDYLTGYEISFAFFYLAPISLAAWYGGRGCGLAVSIFAAVIWQFANYFAGEKFSSSFIPYWNAITRLGFFVVVAILLARIRFLLESERELSRMDHLTGVLNSRAFDDIASAEVKRADRNRQPITLGFLDLDDFKAINDHYGHAVGDQILRVVSQTIFQNVRRSDAVARIGGDEFLILLPETGEEGAKIVMEKLQSLLNSEIQNNAWSVGFSIGAVTFAICPDSVHQMITAADAAMYTAKRNGKNRLEHVVVSNPVVK